ncbi:hypothetical protein ATN83_1862 [Raoultella ornithinolytica]|nr:hypothetical protein ATN83_1862 [Raoultella ornithinolytica]
MYPVLLLDIIPFCVHPFYDNGAKMMNIGIEQRHTITSRA